MFVKRFKSVLGKNEKAGKIKGNKSKRRKPKPPPFLRSENYFKIEVVETYFDYFAAIT